MNGIVFALLLVAMALTFFSLAAGLVVMVKGGKTNELYGNKLMRARVYFQGIAIALFALAFLMSNNNA
ncbi:MAG: twin transmembrane helix small protein [Bdellovibrionales bacterium]